MRERVDWYRSILFCHLIERGIEKDVSVCGVGHEEIERGIAGCDYCNWTFDDICPIEVCQVAFLAEGIDLGMDIWPQGIARGLEVDEEDNGLRGRGVEDAVGWYLRIRVKVGYGVLMLEYVQQRIDI